MTVDMGLIWGGIAAAGAAWRAYKGYQAHTKKKNYEDFSWRKFLVSVLPATVAGFVAGATLSSTPDILSSQGLMLAFMFFTGGAGIGSLQGKLPGMTKKK